jgi:hypothetical protein
MRSRYLSIASGLLLATCVLAATSPAHAKDPDLEKTLWGNHSGYLGIEPSFTSGSIPGTVPVAQPGVPAPVAQPALDYSRTRAQLVFHAGAFAAQTMFKTLLGFETKGAIGYGAGATKDAESNTNFRLDFMASYALFRWKGPLPGRLIFAPGLGIDSDPGRSYSTTFGYATIGARLVAHPGKDLDVRVLYDLVPNVGGAVSVTQHQFNFGLNYKAFAAGARMQLNRVRPAGPAFTETVLGGHIGIAF